MCHATAWRPGSPLPGECGEVRDVKARDTGVDSRPVAAAKEQVLEKEYCPAFENGAPVVTPVTVKIVNRVSGVR